MPVFVCAAGDPQVLFEAVFLLPTNAVVDEYVGALLDATPAGGQPSLSAGPCRRGAGRVVSAAGRSAAVLPEEVADVRL